MIDGDLDRQAPVMKIRYMVDTIPRHIDGQGWVKPFSLFFLTNFDVHISTIVSGTDIPVFDLATSVNEDSILDEMEGVRNERS
ncbi:MAG: hypothetical protein WC375_01140 [Methanomassiliicoccales archaeon]